MSEYENARRIAAEKVFGARTARSVWKTTVRGERTAGAECDVYESMSRGTGVSNNENIWRMSARHKQAATNKWRMSRTWHPHGPARRKFQLFSFKYFVRNASFVHPCEQVVMIFSKIVVTALRICFFFVSNCHQSQQKSLL